MARISLFHKDKHINAILIATILAAMLSPFCQTYETGQSWLLEICGSQGTYTIEIPADGEETPADNEQNAHAPCGFCVFSAQINGAMPGSFAMAAKLQFRYSLSFPKLDNVSHVKYAVSFDARAPPVVT